MTEIKKINDLEFITLLHKTAELLDFAYQETMNKEMWFTSEKLRQACDVLKYEFQINNNLTTIH